MNEGYVLSCSAISVKGSLPLLVLLATSFSCGIDSKWKEWILQPNLHDGCQSISSLEPTSLLFWTLSCYSFALLSVVLSLLLLYLSTKLFGVPTSLPHFFMSSMHYLLASTTTKALYPTLYFDNSVESMEERREKYTFLMCLEVEPTHFIFTIWIYITIFVLFLVTLVMALESSRNTCYHICILFDTPADVLFSTLVRAHDRRYILRVLISSLLI